MPTLTRTQKRQAATREKIFRVAMELFAKKGFEHTTVAEITEAADIGKGTFFTYFPTKEAIFHQPGKMAMENMSLVVEQGLQAGQPIAKILKNVITVSADWHEENKIITRQMSKSNLAFASDESSNKGNLQTLLASLIVKGQKSGEFKKQLNASDAALVLVGTYFAVITAWSHSEGRPLRAWLESSLNTVLEGLAA